MSKAKRQRKQQVAAPLFALAIKKNDRLSLYGGDGGVPLFESERAALDHGTLMFGENPKALTLLAVRIGEMTKSAR